MNDQQQASEGIVAEREFLAFRLGKEEYGVPILLTQEVRSVEPVTVIANAPAHMKGVLNLRGVIVPVMDMRVCFNTGPDTVDAETVVIILQLHGRVIGMVVDAVSDVIRLPDSAIRPAPEVGTAFSADVIDGIGQMDEGRMIILIDIIKVMRLPEVGLLKPEA
ncbi:chemotaxis protein CheW [Undibacterium luofuense]|jgi:purine-binding chemotaxis protein CheW|uniref:Chemotaxis protein CheW n=1 Tax=Undibacterium luofuense TaxID=2828733 RepID=A0A941DLS0_9BURK|nr:chemotaxis protein CheW [Undibacterium luofuense]MBR7783138.1 chemotaxis protein CheW [Undibacterium luofuense]